MTEENNNLQPETNQNTSENIATIGYITKYPSKANTNKHPTIINGFFILFGCPLFSSTSL